MGKGGGGKLHTHFRKKKRALTTFYCQHGNLHVAVVLVLLLPDEKVTWGSGVKKWVRTSKQEGFLSASRLEIAPYLSFTNLTHFKMLIKRFEIFST